MMSCRNTCERVNIIRGPQRPRIRTPWLWAISDGKPTSTSIRNRHKAWFWPLRIRQSSPMLWRKPSAQHPRFQIASLLVSNARSYHFQYRAPTMTSSSSYQRTNAITGTLLGAFAEAVQEEEKENRDDGVDERGDEEAHIEPGFGLRQQNAARETDQSLMRDEENSGKGEACRGMLSIQACPDRGSEIPDDGFGDAIEPQGNRGAAEAVLEQTDGHAQEKSGGRIAPAETEINRHEQRQIQDSHSGKMNRKRCLDHQRQQGGDDDSAGAKLVHLDVRSAASDFKGVNHGFAAVEELATPGVEGCAAAGSASLFISKG